jgi:hypothetical protein
MIPDFEPGSGYLPPGEHEATWTEIRSRFGWNPRRRELLDGLADALAALAAAGCSTVWLNGSFVTAKDEPGDFDAVWNPSGVDAVVLERLAPELFDFADQRAAQKRRFRGELFPNYVERSSGLPFADFFQTDRLDRPKGIVVVDPRIEEWS